MLQLNPGAHSFGFPFLLIISSHPLQDAISALRVLGVVNSRGESLALNLLVYK